MAEPRWFDVIGTGHDPNASVGTYQLVDDALDTARSQVAYGVRSVRVVTDAGVEVARRLGDQLVVADGWREEHEDASDDG